ncbi:MAG TPA: GTPase (G3E family) [Ruminococcaceae bacterium]|nr:GTPase (G3E family) [Oscillospiraceae bacterium]
MIKVDLITGFLGSGKTTFIKMYAKYLLDRGLKIGILENDYGAVNVDMMLLSELEGENCVLETVAGACDADCHRRRFKTKLIALGMSGLDRVIIEPSGIFDVDEFFDALHESPLDRWYEQGSVITVLDAVLEANLSENSRYLLASQAASAGLVVLSKTQFAKASDIEKTIETLNSCLANVKCPRRITGSDLLSKPWSELEPSDFERVSSCGCSAESFVKLLGDSTDAYQSLYFMNLDTSEASLKVAAEELLEDKSCGSVFRIKGFIREKDGWLEINAAHTGFTVTKTDRGQDIVIVIGENLNSGKIEEIIRR